MIPFGSNSGGDFLWNANLSFEELNSFNEQEFLKFLVL